IAAGTWLGRPRRVGVVIAGVAIVGTVAATATVTAIGTDGRIPHSGSTASHVGVSPWALLKGQLTDDTPVTVLHVSGSDEPAYLRTFTLERWTANKGFGLSSVTADDRNIDGSLPRALPAGHETTVDVVP